MYKKKSRVIISLLFISIYNHILTTPTLVDLCLKTIVPIYKNYLEGLKSRPGNIDKLIKKIKNKFPLPDQLHDKICQNIKIKNCPYQLYLPKQSNYPLKEGSIATFALSNSGNKIAIASTNKKIYLWDANNNELIKTYDTGENRVRTIIFSNNDELLTFIDVQGNFVQVNQNTNKIKKLKIHCPLCHQFQFCTLTKSKDGSTLGLTFCNGAVYSLDLNNLSYSNFIMNRYVQVIDSFCLNDNGENLALALNKNSKIYIKNKNNNKMNMFENMFNYKSPINIISMKFDSKSKRLAVASCKKDVTLLDLDNFATLWKTENINIREITGFIEEDLYLATLCCDETIKILDSSTGQVLQQIDTGARYIYASQCANNLISFYKTDNIVYLIKLESNLSLEQIIYCLALKNIEQKTSTYQMKQMLKSNILNNLDIDIKNQISNDIKQKLIKKEENSCSIV